VCCGIVMQYCVVPQSSEMECSGCANCITILFDEIAPQLVNNNRCVVCVCVGYFLSVCRYVLM